MKHFLGFGLVIACALSLLVGCASTAPSSSTSSADATSASASSSSNAATSSAASSASSADAPDLSKLAIIHTNDVHGYIQDSEDALGLTAVAQLKADLTADGYDVVLFDAGDVLQGNTLVGYYNGEDVPGFMNSVGYDVMALGNHEFDYGADVLQKRMAACNFPVLCANVVVDETGEPYATPHTIITTEGGKKIGVFALLTPSTKTQSRPGNTAGLTFLSNQELYACAQEQVDALRAEGVDLVVCLSHLGEDNEVGANKGTDVAKNTEGIDVVVNAHDHKVQNETVANKNGVDVPLFETGSYLANIGVVTFEKGTPTEKLYAVGEYTGQDAAIKTEIDNLADNLDNDLSERIGQTAFELNGGRKPGVRDTETNLGDFVTDALLWIARNNATDAPDAALVNGGGLRTSIPAGDITIRNVLDVMPFTNDICTVRVTGAQLLETLEAACQSTPEENGGFPHVAGITFTVDTSVPYEQGDQYPNSEIFGPAKPGSRVNISDVNGKGFALDAEYVLATLNFIAEGGDCYYAFAEAASKSYESMGYLDYQALRFYLEDECAGVMPDAYADPWGQGRITILNEQQLAEAA